MYEVNVTRADVREFVENTSTGVLVDAVVAELEAKLQLVGDHTLSTVLTPATIQYWIGTRVKDGLGEDKYGEILRENAA